MSVSVSEMVLFLICQILFTFCLRITWISSVTGLHAFDANGGLVLWLCQHLEYIGSGGRMTDEWWIRKDSEISDRDLIEIKPQHLLGRTEENPRTLSEYGTTSIWRLHLPLQEANIGPVVPNQEGAPSGWRMNFQEDPEVLRKRINVKIGLNGSV